MTWFDRLTARAAALLLRRLGRRIDVTRGPTFGVQVLTSRPQPGPDGTALPKTGGVTIWFGTQGDHEYLCTIAMTRANLDALVESAGEVIALQDAQYEHYRQA